MVLGAIIVKCYKNIKQLESGEKKISFIAILLVMILVFNSVFIALETAKTQHKILWKNLGNKEGYQYADEKTFVTIDLQWQNSISYLRR